MKRSAFASVSFLLGLLGTLLISPTPSSAQTYSVLVFGPLTFERGLGPPRLVTTEFSIPDPTMAFTLQVRDIESGPQGNLGTITSAFIMLNGELVMAPPHFNGNVPLLETPVDLLSHNVLSVFLEGQPGGQVRLKIIGEIECPPGGCPPLSVQIGLDLPAATTRLVSIEGASLHTVDAAGVRATLDIPEGALGVATEITMTPVDAMQGLPLLGGLAGAVAFEPEGLTLARPAILTLELPGNLDPTELLGIGWSGDGADLHLEPTLMAGNRISLLITHFSGAGVGEGDPENAAAGMTGTSVIESSFKTLLVRESERLAQEICDGRCDTAEENEAFQEAVTEIRGMILSEWLAAVEQLATRSHLDDVTLGVALREYFAWEATARWTLCELAGACALFDQLFEVRRDFVRLDLAAGFHATMSRAAQECDDRAVLGIVADLALFGFETELASLLGISPANLETELRERLACQLVIEVQGFPAEIAEDEFVDFTVRLTHNTTGTPLAGVEVTITNRDVGLRADQRNRNEVLRNQRERSDERRLPVPAPL